MAKTQKIKLETWALTDANLTGNTEISNPTITDDQFNRADAGDNSLGTTPEGQAWNRVGGNQWEIIQAGTEPDAISGLLGWWEADAITGLDDGDTVATWQDSSSNDKDLSQGSGNPTYETNVVNSLPVVRYIGSAKQHNVSSVGVNGLSAATMFCILRTDDAALGADFYVAGSITTIDPYSEGFDILVGGSRTFGVGARCRTNSDTGTILDATATYDDGEPHVVGIIYDSTRTSNELALRFDGAETATDAVSGSTLSTGDGMLFSAGQFGGGSPVSAYQGDIAEVAIFNSALSSSDITDVERYLNIKYGLDGLGARCKNTGVQRTFIYTTYSDFTAELKLTITNHTSDGILFRYVDESNYWAFHALSSSYQLAKREGGSLVQIDAAGSTPADGDVLKVVAKGSEIECFVNGVSIITASNSNLQWGIRHGIQSGGNTSRFDDFKLEENLDTRIHKPFTPDDLDSLIFWVDASDPDVEPRSPETIDNNALVLWAKADAITGLSDMDLVSSWTDSGDFGNDLEAAGSERPTYIEDGFGGHPTLRFDGSSTLMITSGLNYPPQTTIFVMYSNRTGNGGTLWSTDGEGSFAPLQRELDVWIEATPEPHFDLTDNLNNHNLLVTEFDFTNDLYRVFLDGRFQGVHTTERTVNSSEIIGIGARSVRAAAETEYLNGDISEVIIFESILSERHRRGVEKYLEDKYKTPLLYANGHEIGHWHDKGPLILDVVNSGLTEQPILTTDSINGLPTVTFNEANSEHLFKAATPLNGMLGATAAVVFKTTMAPSGSTKYPFSFSRISTDNGMDISFENTDDMSFRVFTSSRQTITITAADWDDGSTRLVIGRYDDAWSGVEIVTEYDGSGRQSQSAPGTTINQQHEITVGGFSSTLAGGHITGDIAEIIVYSRGLSDWEVRLLARYLSDKWGIILAE